MNLNRLFKNVYPKARAVVSVLVRAYGVVKNTTFLCFFGESNPRIRKKCQNSALQWFDWCRRWITLRVVHFHEMLILFVLPFSTNKLGHVSGHSLIQTLGRTQMRPSAGRAAI